MKNTLHVILIALFALKVSAETIVIRDEFDNGTLGTNTTGTGTGFHTYGQTATTESGGFMNQNGTESTANTHVAQSKDSFNPFQTTSTTLRYKFGVINRDVDGQRLYLGYRLASSSADHFLPGVQGIYIALIAEHDGPASGLTNPPGVLWVTDDSGVTTELARWTWGSGTNLDGLEVVLTTTATSYDLSFMGAVPDMVSGSLSGGGLDSALGSITSNFATAIHNQYWGASTAGGVTVDRAEVILNGPEIAVEHPLTTNLVSGSSSISFGNQRIGTNSSAKTFTIFNRGDENLSITSAALSATTEFTLNDSSLLGSIPPGGSTTFTVTYSPTALGAANATVTITNSDSDEGSFTFTVSGTGIDSDISISGNSITIANGDTSTSILDGTDYGSVSIGGTVSNLFAVTNTGDVDLTFTGSPIVQITGPDAANFVAVSEPNSPLEAPNGLSTFDIEFTPTKLGPHYATVTIQSDDGTDPIYTFDISGTGITPSVFAYTAEGYNVKQGTTSMNFVITRTSGTSPTSIRFTTIDGNVVVQTLAYQEAIDGVDYVGKDEVLNFAQDELSKTVTVTLIPRTGKQPHRRFFAILSEVATGNSIVRDWAVGRIFSYVDPQVVITSPAATVANISNVSPLTISGTVRDSELFGIDRVEVSLNGSYVGDAVLGTGTTTRTWSLPISPTPGVINTVQAKAYDNYGLDSQVASRAFHFTLRRTLAISRTAPSGVGLDAAGTVAVAVTPSTSVNFVTPATTTNASPRDYGVLPGAIVRLTATPKVGSSFSEWSGLPGGAVELGNVVTFTMPDADVLGVTAHFVENTFSGPTGSSNTFYGHVRPASAAEYGNASLGFVTGTIVPTTGAFSGNIRIGGITQSFSGTFYQGGGSFLFNVGTTRPASLSFAGGRTLQLTYSGMDKTITATVVQSGVTSTGILQRGAYSATHKVPDVYLNESAVLGGPLARGFYTVALTPKANPLPLTNFPQGAGYGSMTLSNLGSFSYAGILADGTSFTASGGIVTGNSGLFFAQLVTPGGATTNLGGSFGGALNFDVLPDSEVTATDVLWTRPSVTPIAGTSAAAIATRLYSAGWPTGIYVDAVGALYAKTATFQLNLDLPVPNAADGNGELVLSQGRLTAPVSVTKFNISGSVVSKIPATNPSFTLAVTSTTGVFGGTFTPNWTPLASIKPTFRGIVVAKGYVKRGYGYFISNVNNTVPQESGLVRLGRQ